MHVERRGAQAVGQPDSDQQVVVGYVFHGSAHYTILPSGGASFLLCGNFLRHLPAARPRLFTRYSGLVDPGLLVRRQTVCKDVLFSTQTAECCFQLMDENLQRYTGRVPYLHLKDGVGLDGVHPFSYPDDRLAHNDGGIHGPDRACDELRLPNRNNSGQG